MFIKLKLYPVNIFPLFSYKYIFFIEQVQYVHIFRIVISHSLSESRIQILPCNCISLYLVVWYVKMEQLMVKDVAIVRYDRYSRKRRAKRRYRDDSFLFKELFK